MDYCVALGYDRSAAVICEIAFQIAKSLVRLIVSVGEINSRSKGCGKPGSNMTPRYVPILYVHIQSIREEMLLVCFVCMMNVVYEDWNYRVTSHWASYPSWDGEWWFQIWWYNSKLNRDVWWNWKHIKSYHHSIGWCKRFIKIHKRDNNQPTDSKQSEQA